MLGSTADTCSSSVYGVFHIVNMLIMDPEVDSRPALFQRLLGSTMDTCLCVSLRGWSSWSRRTPDARHHGRYGPEGQFYARFLVTLRCRVVVNISLLMVLTILHGTT